MKVFHIHYLKLKRPWLAPFKYVLQTAKTFWCLWKEQPKFVMVMNPPIFAVAPVWLYCRVVKAKYAIDTHSGPFFEKKWLRFNKLFRFFARQAATNVVTNDYLAGIINRWGGDAFIIGDVPQKTLAIARENNYAHTITVINSFSYDEPLEGILQAAERMSHVHFFITGDTRLAPLHLLKQAADNVQFSGFLPQEEYLSLISSSDATLVLTTENYTMQRGAYESISLGVPVVTSNWPILVETFEGGAKFCNNTPSSIIENVQHIIDNKSVWRLKAQQHHQVRLNIYHEKIESFKETILTFRQNESFKETILTFRQK